MKNSQNRPEIQIDKIVEHKDGSATYYFSFDNDFTELVKKTLGLSKKPTKKIINKFILDCLERGANE